MDGLRGIAILMVMLSHSIGRDLNGGVPRSSLSTPRILFDVLAHEGFRGVSLFLVLSGFCLSYPALKRRAAGDERWFVPSQFFARRCLRILPPYYAALLLFSVWSALALRHWVPYVQSLGPPVSAPDMLSHLLLLHNVTPWYASFNGAFWSLGLEWQWYWLFPLVLAACIRAPRMTIAACLGFAVLWHCGTHDLWQMWRGTVSGALPERLFEFCCGILVAMMVVKGWKWRGPLRPILAGACLLPLFVALIPPLASLSHVVLGQPQPIYGIAFASLLFAGHYSPSLSGLLSWRPLVWLGTISYSVYLVHQPFIELVQASAPGLLQGWPLLPLLGIVAGTAVGWLFHLVVEKPCLHRSTWNTAQPVLMRALSWTDAGSRLYLRSPQAQEAVSHPRSPSTIGEPVTAPSLPG